VNITTSNTILYCRKWNDTVAFYRDVLKLDVHFSNEWFVEFILNSQARLSIAHQERTSIKSSGGRGVTVCFQIDDAEIMHKYLKELGTHPTLIRDLWESRVFYVRDPEGNRLEFWS
jgi:catechol 2,3-dioxygenase-like lactoylglutathione lyase family enzyme